MLFTEVDYKGMEPVKAIEMGDGSVSIMDIDVDGEGRAGIAFKKQEAGDVGADSGDGGKKLDAVNPDLIILTSNPESLKVLLDKVQRAIEHLASHKE